MQGKMLKLLMLKKTNLAKKLVKLLVTYKLVLITIFNLVGNCNNYCVFIIIHGDINFRRYRVTMNLNVQCQKYKCYIGL